MPCPYGNLLIISIRLRIVAILFEIGIKRTKKSVNSCH